MGVIYAPEVVALRVSGKIVCRECWTDDEWNKFKEEDAILQSEVEDEEIIFFCDRSGHRL